MSQIFIPIIIFLGLIILISSFFIVKQQTAAIIERFGRFLSIRQSGLQLKIPLVDRVAGRLSLKIQQLDVIVETKTKDVPGVTDVHVEIVWEPTWNMDMMSEEAKLELGLD